MTLDVRTICLGILSRQEASGYELQKALKEDAIGHFVEASYGSIYPALTRLMDEGLVSCREFQQEGRPDKKIYTITPDGLEVFRQALLEQPADDKFRSEFLFFMLFADQISTSHLLELIDNRFAHVQERRDLLALAEPSETPGEQFVRGYGHTVFKAAVEYIENNRHLLEPSPPQVRRKETV